MKYNIKNEQKNHFYLLSEIIPLDRTTFFSNIPKNTFCIWLQTLTLCTHMEKKYIMSAEKTMTITGDILPWAHGSDCRVAVVDGDTEFGVLPRGAGSDLVDYLSDRVEVSGIVSEDEEGLKRILVRRYHAVDILGEALL